MIKRESLIEVISKTDREIEIETAYKWAERAKACYYYYKKTKTAYWLKRAEDMEHEAIEHAAMARDDGVTLRKIEKDIVKVSSAVSKVVKQVNKGRFERSSSNGKGTGLRSRLSGFESL